MDLQRIKAILASNEEIPVHYHGVPVWIENVEPTSSMAMVSQRGNHDHRRMVAIDAFEES